MSVQTSSQSHVPQGSLKVSAVMKISFALAPPASSVLRSQAYGTRLDFFFFFKLITIPYVYECLPSCVPPVCLVPREVRTGQILEIGAMGGCGPPYLGAGESSLHFRRSNKCFEPLEQPPRFSRAAHSPQSVDRLEPGTLF